MPQPHRWQSIEQPGLPLFLGQDWLRGSKSFVDISSEFLGLVDQVDYPLTSHKLDQVLHGASGLFSRRAPPHGKATLPFHQHTPSRLLACRTFVSFLSGIPPNLGHDAGLRHLLTRTPAKFDLLDHHQFFPFFIGTVRIGNGRQVFGESSWSTFA